LFFGVTPMVRVSVCVEKGWARTRPYRDKIFLEPTLIAFAATLGKRRVVSA
jgi:hypothetical protein